VPSLLERPLIVLVTDRRRLDGGTAALLRQADGAVQAGISILQIREPDLDGGPLERLVRDCLDIAQGSATRVVVNDRLDVALGSGAHGVHLRSDSVDPARGREIAPEEFVIGRSVHVEDQSRLSSLSQASDYFVFGTVFETGSKPGNPAAGVQALRRAVRGATAPVLAIGGVTVDRLSEIVRAGAAGFAAVGMFLDLAGPAFARKRVKDEIARARRSFAEHSDAERGRP
jgi:thiamine-phosphate diphosphorylase